MKNFFQNMGLKMAQGMQGRYGNDTFSNGLIITAIIFILLSLIPGLDLLNWVSTACIAYALFRTLSRNIVKRRQENAVFEKIIAKPKRSIALAQKAWTNRKTTLYFKCKGCGQVLSVPRGKGKLRVVCPHCKKETHKKS